MNISHLSAYVIGGGVSAVSGWLNEGASSATVAIAKYQHDNGIFGDVAEIGVHHGKYFIVLANLRNTGEKAYAVDIFEDQHLNPDKSGAGDRVKFEANIRKYTDEQGVSVIKIDSKKLTATMLNPDGDTRNVRLFSVDGSHTADYTFSDLRFAESVLVDGGVVAVDDFYNPDWPGVQEGVHGLFHAPGNQLLPFAYGCNKLFLTQREFQERYFHYFADVLGPLMLHRKLVQLAGVPVVHFSFPPPSKIFDGAFVFNANVYRLGRSSLTTRCQMLRGWANADVRGVWTVGPSARVKLDVSPPSREQDIQVEIEAIPYLHPRRSSRTLSLRCGDALLGSYTIRDKAGETARYFLPRGLLGNTVELTLEIEAPEAPADVAGSTDARTLGFFIRSIRLLPAGPEGPAPRG